MGDVEALDARGEFGKHERVGERFLNGFARWLEDAEALDVGLLGVLPGEVDERAFFTALRDGNFDAVVDAFAEERGEGFAIVEVDGDEDGAGDVVLVDVELFEEGGEDLPASKAGSSLPPMTSSWMGHPRFRSPSEAGSRVSEAGPRAPASSVMLSFVFR